MRSAMFRPPEMGSLCSCCLEVQLGSISVRKGTGSLRLPGACGEGKEKMAKKRSF